MHACEKIWPNYRTTARSPSLSSYLMSQMTFGLTKIYLLHVPAIYATLAKCLFHRQRVSQIMEKQLLA